MKKETIYQIGITILVLSAFVGMFVFVSLQTYEEPTSVHLWTESEFDSYVELQIIIEQQNETINKLKGEVEMWKYMFNDVWDTLHECVEGR